MSILDRQEKKHNTEQAIVFSFSNFTLLGSVKVAIVMKQCNNFLEDIFFFFFECPISNHLGKRISVFGQYEERSCSSDTVPVADVT